MVKEALDLLKGGKGALAEKVDKLGQMKAEIEALEKEFKKLKQEVQEEAEKQGKTFLEGNTYKVEYVPEDKVEINVDNLKQYLKDWGMPERFSNLVKPNLTSVRKVLGDAAVEELGKITTKKYAKSYIKKKED